MDDVRSCDEEFVVILWPLILYIDNNQANTPQDVTKL